MLVEGDLIGRMKRIKRLWRGRRKSAIESGHRKCAHLPAQCRKSCSCFFACGRRLEFEKRIAGFQESRQRSSATRQVGKYFVVSTAADRGNGAPEAWIHRAHVSKPKHIITLLTDSKRLVVRLSEKHCQLGLIVLYALPVGQTSEAQEPGFRVVGTHAPGVACCEFDALFNLVCGFEWQNWFQHVQTDWQRAESGGGCQWSRSVSSGGDLALVAPTNKKKQPKRLHLEVYARNQTSH